MSIFHNQNPLTLESKDLNLKIKLQNKENNNTANIDTNANLNILITDNIKAINRLECSVKQIESYLQNQSNQLKNDSFCYQNSKNQIASCKKYSIHIENLLQKNTLQIQKQLKQLKNEFEIKNKQMFNQLQRSINQKGNREQIQRAINLSNLLCIEIQQIKQRQKNAQKKSLSIQKMSKVNREQMLNLHQISLNKLKQVNLSSLQKENRYLYEKMEYLQNEMKLYSQKQMNQQKNSQQYKKIVDMVNFINKNNEKSQKQIQSVQSNCQYALKSFCERLKTLETLLKQCQACNIKIDQFKTQILQIQSKTQQIQFNFQNSQTKIIFQIQQSLKNNKKQCQKMSTKFNEKLMGQIQSKFMKKKQTLSQFQQVQQRLTDFNSLNTSVQNKIKKLETQLQVQITQFKQSNLELLGKITKDITLKASKDQLRKQILKYIQRQQMQDILIKHSEKIQLIIQKSSKQQKIINNALCSQNIIARWLWDGDIKGGNLVNWSKSVINTLPQNFIYLDKQHVIYIFSSGLYRIQMGFYSKKKPTVQILVNGKMVVSAVNSSSYVIHHSSGKLKQIGTSQVTGLTYIDFLMIPEGSRIAITYNSQSKGQGFININRL